MLYFITYLKSLAIQTYRVVQMKLIFFGIPWKDKPMHVAFPYMEDIHFRQRGNDGFTEKKLVTKMTDMRRCELHRETKFT